MKEFFDTSIVSSDSAVLAEEVCKQSCLFE